MVIYYYSVLYSCGAEEYGVSTRQALKVDVMPVLRNNVLLAKHISNFKNHFSFTCSRALSGRQKYFYRTSLSFEHYIVLFIASFGMFWRYSHVLAGADDLHTRSGERLCLHRERLGHTSGFHSFNRVLRVMQRSMTDNDNTRGFNEIK